MKKFQAIMREFTRFSVVSTVVEYFFLVRNFPWADFVVAANDQSVISARGGECCFEERQSRARAEGQDAEGGVLEEPR